MRRRNRPRSRAVARALRRRRAVNLGRRLRRRCFLGRRHGGLALRDRPPRRRLPAGVSSAGVSRPASPRRRVAAVRSPRPNAAIRSAQAPLHPRRSAPGATLGRGRHHRLGCPKVPAPLRGVPKVPGTSSTVPGTSSGTTLSPHRRGRFGDLGWIDRDRGRARRGTRRGWRRDALHGLCRQLLSLLRGGILRYGKGIGRRLLGAPTTDT